MQRTKLFHSLPYFSQHHIRLQYAPPNTRTDGRTCSNFLHKLPSTAAQQSAAAAKRGEKWGQPTAVILAEHTCDVIAMCQRAMTPMCPQLSAHGPIRVPSTCLCTVCVHVHICACICKQASSAARRVHRHKSKTRFFLAQRSLRSGGVLLLPAFSHLSHVVVLVSGWAGCLTLSLSLSAALYRTGFGRVTPAAGL